jgi:hypothetical protein
VMQTFNIVGIHKGDRGRNCKEHQEVCGAHIQVGDIVTIKRAIVGIGNSLEVCLGVFKMDENNQPTCRIGFVPKA